MFEHIDLFDYIVAENGALLYSPTTPEEKLLGAKPPDEFVKMHAVAQVDPLPVGRVILATWHLPETTVLSTIRDLGLELSVNMLKGNWVQIKVFTLQAQKASCIFAPKT